MTVNRHCFIHEAILEVALTRIHTSMTRQKRSSKNCRNSQLKVGRIWAKPEHNSKVFVYIQSQSYRCGQVGYPPSIVSFLLLDLSSFTASWTGLLGYRYTFKITNNKVVLGFWGLLDNPLHNRTMFFSDRTVPVDSDCSLQSIEGRTNSIVTDEPCLDLLPESSSWNSQFNRVPRCRLNRCKCSAIKTFE